MEGRITATEEESGVGAPVESIGIEVERCICAKSRKKPTNKKYRNLNKNRPENLCYIYTRISWGKNPKQQKSPESKIKL
jgi:hypothetical protein